MSTQGEQFLNNVTYLGGTELLAAYYYKTNGWRDGSRNGGLLHSTDLGATWQPISTEFAQTTFNGPGVLYVGGGNVVRYGKKDVGYLDRSSDYGQTWTTDAAVVDGHLVGNCSDAYPAPCDYWTITAMAWNQVEGAGSVVLAGGELYTRAYGTYTHTDTRGLWKSTDGGDTWTMLYTGAENDWVASVAIDPAGEILMSVERIYYIPDPDPGAPRQLYYQVLYKWPDEYGDWALANDPGQPPQPDNPDDPTGRYTAGVAFAGNPDTVP